ncbi:MAG: hypothetical protein AAB209_13440 [Bacteroidota bacterium]|jgi:hypothetical protein
MIDVMLQKTATSELWWIGTALALILIAWTVVGMFRLLKRKRMQRMLAQEQVKDQGIKSEEQGS